MSENMGRVWSTSSADFGFGVDRLLKAAELEMKLKSYKRVVLKPNLIEASKPPITTPVELVEDVVCWLKEHCPYLEIIVAEGNGVPEYDTAHCFEQLGYNELAEKYGLELVDLNKAEFRLLNNSQYQRLPDFELPEILFDSYLVSIPVLKAHSMSEVTLSMKNVVGCAPSGQGGGWRKAQLHRGLHEAIVDLNRYRSPDFSIIDASIGMAQAHLWGPQCDPPVGKILASYDPVAIDSYGAKLLGKNWQDIGHIRQAHGLLGKAAPLVIEEV